MNQQTSAVILLGPPGSGKSTITGYLTAYKGVAAVETGQLLREEAARDTPLGRKLDQFLGQGDLAPLDLVIEVIRRSLQQIEAAVILFDGFPRRNDQIPSFFELGEETEFELAAVIGLQLPHAQIMKRLTGRRVCPRCGAIYNVHFDPPRQPGVCDQDGAELEQREDDKPEIVRQRIEVYEQETQPVAAYFETNYPNLTHSVSAEGSIEEVVESLSAILKELYQEIDE